MCVQIDERLERAVFVSKFVPILTFILISKKIYWIYVRAFGPLPQVLATQVQLAAGLGAEGVVLWGASSDYHGLFAFCWLSDVSVDSPQNNLSEQSFGAFCVFVYFC